MLLPSVDLGETALEELLAAAGCRRVLRAEDAGAPGVPDSAPGRHPAGPGAPAAAPEPAADPAQTMFLLTTSGSTGRPKIVPLSAGAVDRFTAWAAAEFGLGPGVPVLSYAPLNFDLCLLDIWATLRAGGCVVLVDQDRAANPRHLVELLAATGPRLVQAVPMFYQLLREGTRGSGRCFPSVETAAFTGDSLPQRALAALPALFPNARLVNVYGCTETNDSFMFEVTDPAAGGAATPIGTPLPGVSALVVADDGRVLTGTGTGELWVHTPFQTPGYLGPAAGHGRFVEHGGRTYFRTGDLVRRDAAGTVTLVGRNDFQVKVRGVAVNLQEIERVLLDHGSIVEAAVVAAPDDVAGTRLLAVVRGTGPGLSGLAVREHCAARLPRAGIPATIRITTEPLPRTSTGKVDRRQIGLML